MTEFARALPPPSPDPETREFWDACAEHRLVVQQCAACGRFRFAPAPICFHCRSFDHRWVQSDGVGEVYTWTVTHRVLHPAVAELVPYNTIVVKLLDCGGALVTSNLVDVEEDDITAGMRVAVVWDDLAPGVAVPRFRAVDEDGSTGARG